MYTNNVWCGTNINFWIDSLCRVSYKMSTLILVKSVNRRWHCICKVKQDEGLSWRLNWFLTKVVLIVWLTGGLLNTGLGRQLSGGGLVSRGSYCQSDGSKQQQSQSAQYEAVMMPSGDHFSLFPHMHDRRRYIWIQMKTFNEKRWIT